MHSPIIYLIEKDSEYAKSMKGELPYEFFPDDEYLLDYIHESDWLVANTLEEKIGTVINGIMTLLICISIIVISI
ncbi:hypothetical protein ACO2FA_12725 [Staphylococcus warneri]